MPIKVPPPCAYFMSTPRALDFSLILCQPFP